MNRERLEHIKELAEENGVDLDIAINVAELLGEDEDHDGLVTTLEDLGSGLML